MTQENADTDLLGQLARFSREHPAFVSTGGSFAIYIIYLQLLARGNPQTFAVLVSSSTPADTLARVIAFAGPLFFFLVLTLVLIRLIVQPRPLPPDRHAPTVRQLLVIIPVYLLLIVLFVPLILTASVVPPLILLMWFRFTGRLDRMRSILEVSTSMRRSSAVSGPSRVAKPPSKARMRAASMAGGLVAAALFGPLAATLSEEAEPGSTRVPSVFPNYVVDYGMGRETVSLIVMSDASITALRHSDVKTVVIAREDIDYIEACEAVTSVLVRPLIYVFSSQPIYNICSDNVDSAIVSL